MNTDELLQPLLKLAPGWACLLAAIIIAGREVRHWLAVHHRRLVYDFVRGATPEQVATAKDMIEGAVTADKPASKALPLVAVLPLLVLMLVAGCGVSAADLRLAGQWRDAALAACLSNGAMCRSGIPCANAVLVLDQIGAGTKELTAAGKACVPYGAPVPK